MARPITLFTGQRADLPFEEVVRLADGWGYEGPLSAEWEDAGTDRPVGAPEALRLVRNLSRYRPSEAAFDAVFSTR